MSLFFCLAGVAVYVATGPGRPACLSYANSEQHLRELLQAHDQLRFELASLKDPERIYRATEQLGMGMPRRDQVVMRRRSPRSIRGRPVERRSLRRLYYLWGIHAGAMRASGEVVRHSGSPTPSLIRVWPNANIRKALNCTASVARYTTDGCASLALSVSRESIYINPGEFSASAEVVTQPARLRGSMTRRFRKRCKVIANLPGSNASSSCRIRRPAGLGLKGVGFVTESQRFLFRAPWPGK